MNAKGVPVLSDIGLARLYAETYAVTITGMRGNERYIAIELLFPDEEAALATASASMNSPSQSTAKFTEASDVWSFAMIVYVSIISEYASCFVCAAVVVIFAN